MATATVTPEEIRRELAARGLTIARWASENGFSRTEVYAVLSGRTRGMRGKANEVARALRLIEPPDVSGRFQFLTSNLKGGGMQG